MKAIAGSLIILSASLLIGCDTIAARLHREDWCVGDMAVKYAGGWVSVVSGQPDGRWVVKASSINAARVDHEVGSRPEGL
jgi:hypothetical protein